MCRIRGVVGLLMAVAGGGAAFADQPTFTPAPTLRSAVLEACRRDVLQEVANDAREGGYGAGAEVTFDEGSVAFVQAKKDRLEASGRGEFRMAADYLFQPMTFRCEWDLAKEKLRKGTYKVPKGADPAALAPEKAVAAESCRRAAEDELRRLARSREYYGPSVDIRRGLRFDAGERGMTLFGMAALKLDSVQDRPTEHEFRCVWDNEQGRVIDYGVQPVDPNQRETGSITCESRDLKRKTCRAPIGGYVRVRGNISDTRCWEGTNWTASAQEIVVWNGCRATFEFEMR